MLGKEPHDQVELNKADPSLPEHPWSLYSTTTGGSGYFQSFRKKQPPPVPHKPPSLCSERVTRASLTGSFVTLQTNYPVNDSHRSNVDEINHVDSSHAVNVTGELNVADKTVTLQDVVKEHPGAQAVFPKGLDHPDCSTILPQSGQTTFEQYSLISKRSLANLRRSMYLSGISFASSSFNISLPANLSGVVEEPTVLLINQPSCHEPTHSPSNYKVIAVFPATVLYDFSPLHQPEHFDDMCIELVAGSFVTVYGKSNIQSSPLPLPLTCQTLESEIGLEGGWCQVEKEDGSSGFAPLSYIQILNMNEYKEKVIEETRVSGYPFETVNEWATADEKEYEFYNQLMMEHQDVLEPDYTPLGYSGCYQQKETGLAVSTTQEPTHTNNQSTTPSITQEPAQSISATNWIQPHQLLNVTNKLTKNVGRMIKSWYQNVSKDDAGALQEFASKQDDVVHSMEACSLADHTTSTHNPSNNVDPLALLGTYSINGYAWSCQDTPFPVSVLPPQKHQKVKSTENGTDMVQEEYYSFPITSSFDTTHLMVYRRYRDFEWLHDQLERIFPSNIIILPSLPPKVWNMTPAELEKRRLQLERYLHFLVQHPLIRKSEVLMLFLWCGSDNDMSLPRHSDEPTRAEDEEWIQGKKVYQDQIQQAEQALGIVDLKTKTSQFLNRIHVTASGLESDLWKKRMIRGYSNHLALMMEHASPFITASKKMNLHLNETAQTFKELSEAYRVMAQGKPTDVDDTHKRVIREYSWCWREGCQECLHVKEKMEQVADCMTECCTVLSEKDQDMQSLLLHMTQLQEMLPLYQSSCQFYELAEKKLESSASVNTSKLDTIVHATLSEAHQYHALKHTLMQDHLLQSIDTALNMHQRMVDSLVRVKSLLT